MQELKKENKKTALIQVQSSTIVFQLGYRYI